MSNQSFPLAHIFWGLLAGFLWTVGFFAAFPVWRYANLPGTLLFSLAVGLLLARLLCAEDRAAWRFRFPAGVGLAAVLLPLLWNAPWFSRWFNSLLLLLYQGFHITEAGFAGLFTIFTYGIVSLLSLLLASLIWSVLRSKQRKDL